MIKSDLRSNKESACIDSNSTRIITDRFTKYKGQYCIGDDVMFSLIKKPSAIHRLFTKLLLGWEWKDF